MSERWRGTAVLAVALFAVNVVARLVTRFGFDGDDTAADRVSLGMFMVIGLVLASDLPDVVRIRCMMPQPCASPIRNAFSTSRSSVPVTRSPFSGMIAPGVPIDYRPEGSPPSSR